MHWLARLGSCANGVRNPHSYVCFCKDWMQWGNYWACFTLKKYIFGTHGFRECDFSSFFIFIYFIRRYTRHRCMYNIIKHEYNIFICIELCECYIKEIIWEWICTFVVYSSIQPQMHLLNVIKNAFVLVLNLSVLVYFEFCPHLNVLLI